jgi:hypothetical protein
MLLAHEKGSALMVDYAGDTVPIWDRDLGSVSRARHAASCLGRPSSSQRLISRSRDPTHLSEHRQRKFGRTCIDEAIDQLSPVSFTQSVRKSL